MRQHGAVTFATCRQRVKPVPTSQHGAVSTSVPHNFQQTKFVFVCRDAHRTPLQQPYESPFEVIQPSLKFFKVEEGGKQETILVDRLKLADVDPFTIVLATPKIQPSTSKTKLSPPDTNVIQPLVFLTPPVPQIRYTQLGWQVNLPK